MFQPKKKVAMKGNKDVSPWPLIPPIHGNEQRKAQEVSLQLPKISSFSSEQNQLYYLLPAVPSCSSLAPPVSACFWFH
jgi:hypothetical protein